MTQEKVLIVGTGALACLFAARLAPHADVVLLGTWPEGLAALRRDGVRLVEADGAEGAYAVRATNDPADCVGHSFALVLVKSWQTARAARQLAACLSEEGVALTMQNGLGNLEQLQAALGKERAALGVTTTGATLLGPGHVRAGGRGPTHVAAHPRLGPFTALMRTAGFEVEATDEMDGIVWGKLVVNAGINPLTALLRIPNGELLQHPDARTLMKTAAAEAAAVAAARGVGMPYDDPIAIVEDVARRTATNRSSMLQDVTRGAPTEIDSICGAIVSEGERLGVATPVNRTLWHLVRALVSSSRGDDT